MGAGLPVLPASKKAEVFRPPLQTLFPQNWTGFPPRHAALDPMIVSAASN
jgi:hypothetical protein